MISRDCIITVNGNTATIDSDIYLYKYDKNIQLIFMVINSKYMYDNDDSNNLIKNMQASYAQVKFKKNDSSDIEIEFDIQATNKGAVLLTINEELTDEDTELGEYTIQIRLLDANKNSVVTLPPVESCIHILAPLFEKMGANTNEVNKAVVNKAVARYAAPLSATTGDGTFNSKTWVDGDTITTAELNRMETGIKTNSTQYKDIANNQPTDLSLDSATNLLQLVNSKGSKLGNGITLPISSGGGISQYLHIKYSSTGAPQLAGQISDTPNAYIGLCVDANADAPINPHSYTWYKWKGEAGAKGDTGATPNLQMGTVTTLESGSNATASITGTTENPLLNLGIPKGDTGTGGSSEKEWRLIRDITLEEDVEVVDINTDEEGNPFKLTEYILQFYGYGDQATNTYLSLGYKSNTTRIRYYTNNSGLSANGTKRYCIMYCKSIGITVFSIGSPCNSNANYANALIPNTIKPENRELIGFNGIIDNISIYTDNGLTKKMCTGSNIKIYGR